MSEPELIPGLEEFWAPDQSAQRLEADVVSQPPRFATGRPLPASNGVVYWGPWETSHDGVCVAVRRNAVALARTKVAVHLQSPTFTHWNDGVVARTYHCELPPEVLEEVGPLTDIVHGRTVGWIKHFVPSTNLLQALTTPSSLLPDSGVFRAMLRSTLAYCALESSAVPEEWLRALDKLAGVLVPCEANRRWFEGAGLQVPVTVVPHPLALRDPMRSVKRSERTDVFRFLNVAKWEPRKSQFALIGAFLTEFSPDEPVQLVLKSRPYWGGKEYPPGPQSAIDYWVGKSATWTAAQAAAAVKLFWRVDHTREQMAKLYGACHAYMQCGRSEGFDLPALDAKVAGLPMAFVGYGGPADFQQPGVDVFIPWTEMRAPPEQYGMPEGTTWPVVQVPELRVAMRQLYERRKESLASFDCSAYLIDSVGAKLRACVDVLAQRSGVELESA